MNPGRSFCLTDYLWILDRASNLTPEAIRRDEMSDWILSFQSPLGARSLENWQAQPSQSWLVSALSHLRGNDPALAQILDAAETIRADSPAFATVAFHRARLLFEAGRKDEARDWIDRLRSEQRAKFSPSSYNQLLSLRSMLALNVDEFLEYSLRYPVTNELFSDRVVDTSDLEELEQGWIRLNTVEIDADTARVLSERLPLSVWQRMASAPACPPFLRIELLRAGWVRAVLLQDSEQAMALGGMLGESWPEFKTPIENYQERATPEARLFAAAHALLRFPGLRPFIASEHRRTPVDRIDNMRDNWWCVLAPPEKEQTWRQGYYGTSNHFFKPLLHLYGSENLPGPEFLTDDERRAGQDEWTRLAAMPAAPDLLSSMVIEWAMEHASDPLVPEALHLAVRSTRYGCTGPETSRYSKAAFQLLHRRYPDSVWAKRTKYWF